MSRTPDPDALAEGVLEGDRRALARAISMVEDARPGHSLLLSRLYPAGGRASVVGVTGAPGSGKSTLVDRLVGHLREGGRSVSVVAVDPTSPFTGGALLGDRVRMQGHVSDPGVYVRSMASRGRLGGLADTTSKVLCLLEAARFDPILLETVGVGQSEVEVVDAADTVVVVLAPGWGDAVQAAKAGILEIGDVLVVNKADLPGAEELEREVARMSSPSDGEGWLRPVVACSALSGEGVEEVCEAVAAHTRHLASTGELEERRRRRAEAAFRRALAEELLARLAEPDGPPAILAEVVARRLDPWSAAREAAG